MSTYGYPKNNGGNSNQQSWKKDGWKNKGGGSGGGFKKREEGPAVFYKPYVITGNADTPADVLEKFRELALKLESMGFIARTSAFEGPDQIVDKVLQIKEIHLPWSPFNERESKLSFSSKNSLEIAEAFHPSFSGLKPGVQKFLSKNVRMALGNNLKSPALFLVCYSQDGAESAAEKSIKTGNIGHLIAVCSAIPIPIFNFGKPDAEQRLLNYLSGSLNPLNKNNGTSSSFTTEPQSTGNNHGYIDF